MTSVMIRSGASASSRSAQGSEGLTIIKPVPEAVEPILYKVFRRSKVEPRVNCLVLARVPACHLENPLGFLNLMGNGHSWMMLSNPIRNHCQLRRFWRCESLLDRSRDSVRSEEG